MAVGYVLINIKPGSELEVHDAIKALEMVEDAVLKYVKIEKWISEKDELNGKASIVIEDDSVRAES